MGCSPLKRLLRDMRRYAHTLRQLHRSLTAATRGPHSANGAIFYHHGATTVLSWHDDGAAWASESIVGRTRRPTAPVG